MLKKQEQLRIHSLLDAGYSAKEVSERTGFSIGTVYNYKRNGKELKGGARDKVKEYPAILPHQKLIDIHINRGKLKLNRLLFEMQQAGYTGTLYDLKRYCMQRKRELHPQREIQHVETGMGEQAQVDWGHFGSVMINGKREKIYLFAYILAYSRVVYLEFVVRQNQRTLQECHINAFEAVGLPKQIVYDNMKTVVDQPKRKRGGDVTPTVFNDKFLGFAKYYDFEVAACYPFYPKAKGKVESTISYVRRYFPRLSIKHTTTLEDLNKRLQEWVATQAHERIHGTTNQKPSDLWNLEKEHLRFPKQRSYAATPPKTYKTSQYGIFVRSKVTYSLGPAYAFVKLEVHERQEHGLPFIDIYHHNTLLLTTQVPSKRPSWISLVPLLPGYELPKVKRKRLPRANHHVTVEQRDLSHYKVAGL